MLQPFLKLSGFKESLTAWLPAVGPSGENLVGAPSVPQLASWWRGPSVVQAIDAMKPSTHDVDKPLRLPVTDVFKGARGSAALGGRLVAGALKVFHLFTRVDAGRPCGSPAEYLHTPGKPCCKASIMTGDAADLHRKMQLARHAREAFCGIRATSSACAHATLISGQSAVKAACRLGQRWSCSRATMPAQ